MGLVEAGKPGTRVVLESIVWTRGEACYPRHDRDQTEDEEVAVRLWEIIKRYTTGPVWGIVEAMDNTNGIEAWRQIVKHCELDLTMRKQAVIQELDALGGGPCGGITDTRTAMFRWDRLQKEITGLTGQALPEEHIKGVLLALLDENTKEAVREHMEEGAESLQRRVLEYLKNTERDQREEVEPDVAAENPREEGGEQSNREAAGHWTDSRKGWRAGTAWAEKREQEQHGRKREVEDGTEGYREQDATCAKDPTMHVTAQVGKAGKEKGPRRMFGGRHRRRKKKDNPRARGREKKDGQENLGDRRKGRTWDTAGREGRLKQRRRQKRREEYGKKLRW